MANLDDQIRDLVDKRGKLFENLQSSMAPKPRKRGVGNVAKAAKPDDDAFPANN